ncbi:branched-chain alpha-keto acid dehydrogenase subunit E2 [Halosimplex carlsbadense 2-9-1]|uniref:Branched-chain alpha-keto acid dehydrogenase subunit E2 n=1 Tax=Halosimplex carlsbadense 2-9-1 TaxID=797114 RepID=M0D0W8_9EURY|nr:dihydrolipoamide acetyltransferase family protein [Halosimplex carlsbadense]ELZ29151.1 branched-chain alpha-keto acid dehydrogenase subunit E2 [Halosimplex carlsbadense 2-9-1]
MVREFKLPDVGEGVAEGELLEWHVEPGDTVAEDQVVADVETDKAVVDVPSPVNGTVRELLAEPGDVVPVGTVIITFDVEGEAPPESERDATTDAETGAVAEGDGDAEAAAESSGNGQGGRVFAAPSARRLARELGVEIAAVDGSGPGGRVTESDVRAAAESQPDESDDGKQLKSAVSRIDDGEDGSGKSSVSDGLSSAVSRVDDGESGGSDAAGGAVAAGAVEAAGRERTLAAPATRQVAEDLGVDIDDVPTDEVRDGQAFVDEAAVREYADAQQRAQEADAEALADASEAGEAGPPTTTAESGAGPDAVEAAEGDRREPYRGVRKTIGRAMERSKFTAPHVTHHEKVDATALVETREKLKARADDRGVKLTFVPFVMKAVAAALDEHPVLNTQLDEDNEEIVFKSDRNFGVAVATDAGLMVPVVDGVDGKGLLQLASETNELVAKCRERSIAREEMQGGTFTITNFGAIGGEYATPIINYPETAILGLGAIEERPVAEDGEVVARDVLPLSLSVDHRVIDGADAARFVETLKEYIEDPTLLLLE